MTDAEAVEAILARVPGRTITQTDLVEMNGGAARVNKLRAEYLRTRFTADRQAIMKQIVELEDELKRRFGLVLDKWDLQETTPGVA